MDRWTDGQPDGWMDVSLYSCHMYCVYSFTEFQKHQLPEGYKQYPEVRSNLGHNRCLWDPINFQGFTREFVIRQEKWRVLAGGTWSLRSAAVTYCTAMRRSGVQFPVGTVYLSSFTSFARDSKWGCRL